MLYLPNAQDRVVRSSSDRKNGVGKKKDEKRDTRRKISDDSNRTYTSTTSVKHVRGEA